MVFSYLSLCKFTFSTYHRTHTRRILFMKPTSEIQSIDLEPSLHGHFDSVSLNQTFMESNCVVIQGSRRGFIIFYSNQKIYLWNPSTRVHRQIPSLHPNHSRLPFYGFGDDVSIDDYLVVSLTYDYIPSSYDVISHLAIFSLRANVKGNCGNYPFAFFLGAVEVIYG